MGQVTIYVEDSALDAAKRAAERAKISVSQWFGKFAIEERQRQSQSWDAFFAEIDHLRGPDAGPDGWDAPEQRQILENNNVEFIRNQSETDCCSVEPTCTGSITPTPVTKND